MGSRKASPFERASLKSGFRLDGALTGARTMPGLPPSPQRDLRTGIIWLGVGIGFAALGLVVSFEEPDALFMCLGLATFPTFIGLAFIALGFLNKSKS